MKTKNLKPSFGIMLLIGISLIWSSCSDEKPKIVSPIIESGHGFFVVNEGTFTMGNASLTYINLENDTSNSETDLFKVKNNRPLGDIFQSMTMINDKAWLMINNSSKIEIIDPKNSQSISTIKNLKSPRYALSVTSDKVYVSDLYANCIHIINSQNYTKTGEIKCNGWTEQMVLFKNKVWVSNFSTNYLYGIDILSDKITDSIKVAFGGSDLIMDKNDKLWLLCSGDAIKKHSGGLFGIDANTMKIEKQWLFTSSDYNPIKLIQNKNEDSLFFINNGVFGFSKSSDNLPTTPIILQKQGSAFYGLSLDKSNGNLVVGDAVDFVSQGKVLIYSAKGSLLKTYKVGVNPGNFSWY